MPIITCWASTFQVAGDSSSAAFSQPACLAPSSECFGSSAASFRGLRRSPLGWSVRYCRVSSTWNSASRPNATLR